MLLGVPSALWALLLIPLIVLLYMLRARRMPQTVPSTLLWERATRDLIARMPVRKLERSILLLLQILAIASIVFALARPSAVLPGVAGDAVAIVIRTTASMQAREQQETRFAIAQRETLALIDRLGPRQRIAVVDAGRHPRVIRDFTTDRTTLRAAVNGLTASDAGGSVDDAVALAGGLRVDGRLARVHVFSDRPPTGASTAQWHAIGEAAPNVAITSAAARRGVRGWSLLVRIEAFGTTGASAPRQLRVTLGDTIIAARPVRALPDVPQVIVFELGDASGLATVRLDGQDALPADDRAVVALGRETLPKVLAVGEPNPVVDLVLNAVPTSSVARADAVAPRSWNRFDLVVLDGVAPMELPPGSYLLIGTVGTNLSVQVEGVLRDQTIRSVSATHPVMRLADLRGVRVVGGVQLRSQVGTVLAEGEVPLVWAYEGRGIRAVMLPFALAQSDLALHPAFPILIANSVSWLAGGSTVTAGDTPIVASGGFARATLLGPTGATTALQAKDGSFVLPPLERVGVYRLSADGWTRTWVVSTVDAGEGDLTVPASVAQAARAAGPQPAHVSLVPWLLMAAVVVAVGEWMLWARSVPPAAGGGRGR
jgi:hypothetical protein